MHLTHLSLTGSSQPCNNVYYLSLCQSCFLHKPQSYCYKTAYCFWNIMHFTADTTSLNLHLLRWYEHKTIKYSVYMSEFWTVYKFEEKCNCLRICKLGRDYRKAFDIPLSVINFLSAEEEPLVGNGTIWIWNGGFLLTGGVSCGVASTCRTARSVN